MVEINPKSKDSIICEDHLYTIKFGLEDVLKIYKSEVKRYNKMDYSKMTGEQIHIMKWYENKIFDTEELLKELELVHIVKTSDKKEEEIKDCQYCCGDVDGRDYLLSNGSEGVYIDGNGKLSGDDDLDFDDKKLNYCPICGRKL